MEAGVGNDEVPRTGLSEAAELVVRGGEKTKSSRIFPSYVRHLHWRVAVRPCRGDALAFIGGDAVRRGSLCLLRYRTAAVTVLVFAAITVSRSFEVQVLG